MGWNARLRSGVVLRQCDGIHFFDVNLDEIEEMWLDGLERASIHRRRCPGFVEFIQYETACATLHGPVKTGEYIGWTNGEREFVVGIICEIHSRHPRSRFAQRTAAVSRPCF